MFPKHGGVTGSYYRRKLLDEETKALRASMQLVPRLSKRYYFLSVPGKPDTLRLEKGGIEHWVKLELSPATGELFCLVEASVGNVAWLDEFKQTRFVEADELVTAVCAASSKPKPGGE